MLPEYIDQNEHYRILCDDRRGFWTLLVSADMLGRGVPFTPLWAQECTDEATLACLCRWLDVRAGGPARAPAHGGRPAAGRGSRGRED
jgi:hypothetical protein